VLVILHLIYLHEEKSSNPLGINLPIDKIPFHPYFSIKDLYSIILIIFIFLILIYEHPFHS
jgi:ubiquinol-cytochrome c reductase cytochrome b subunit